MRRIRLLGGMSRESSAECYRLLNQATRERLGGLRSADCLLRSVDADVEQLRRPCAWHAVAALGSHGLETIGLLAHARVVELAIDSCAPPARLAELERAAHGR